MNRKHNFLAYRLVTWPLYLIWQLHIFFDQLFLLGLICAGTYHVTDSLVECLDLLGLEVADDCVDGGQQFVDERHDFTDLYMEIQNIQLNFVFLVPESGQTAAYT